MKKLFVGLLLGLVLSVSAPARAENQIELALQSTAHSIATASYRVADMLNWKVGDTSTYSIHITGLPIKGSLVKSVTKLEEHAVWLHEVENLIIKKQVVDVLLSTQTGRVLKMITDGKEMPAGGDDHFELISQDFGKVTVPAGTFEAMHIVASNDLTPRIELWANPNDVVLDGTIKQIVFTTGTAIIIELESQKRAPATNADAD